MKTLSIKKTWFSESDLRLDASYHLSDGPLTKIKFKKSPYDITPLSEETVKIFKGNIFKRIYVADPEKGHEFLTASDMAKADIFSNKYLSKKFTNPSNLLFEKGWTLVSRSGTLGNTAYTNEDFEKTLGSDDLIRIVPNNKKILSGYLYAYLSSKFGYGLLTQSGYGGVIQHIEPHHLSDLPIPVLPNLKQKEIHNLIEESSRQRVQSNRSLQDAIKYFEKKFSEPIGYQKIFTKKHGTLGFSWVGKNNDLIAELTENNIRSSSSLIIGSIASRVFAPPLFKHIYLQNDNGYPFFTGADVSKSFKRPYRYLSKLGVKKIEDYVISNNQILVYKSGPRDGMLGATFLVDYSIENACLSDHVIRVEIENKNLRNWTFAFLRSKTGLRQLHNIATGTAILFITPSRLSELAIPAPDDNLESISKLIDSYKYLADEAYKKEKKAIELVETEIESWEK